MQKPCPEKNIPFSFSGRWNIVKNLSIFCWWLLSAVSGKAQLCQGSLGDPIVNITFGAGFNPGAPLSAATTAYQYTSVNCPEDGYYTVRNSTASCFNSSWFTLLSDHTGNTNGYFMLVNASYQPSAFYVDTVSGLCGNTTYEFAAWVMNIQLSTACNGNPTPPNLTFRVEKTDGTLLQSYNVGTIPFASSPIWKQYGSFFTTPSGVSKIILRMVNNAPGGCGNDIALDDITFRACGPTIVSSITGETSNTVNMCTGTARTFSFASSSSGLYSNPAYQWQQRYNAGSWSDIAGATSTTLTQNFTTSASAGTYEYRLSVTDAANIASLPCRVSSQPLTIMLNATPVAMATSNSPVCSGQNLILHAAGGTQYTWTGPNGFAATGESLVLNNVQPTQEGTYTLVASNAGCIGTSVTNILIYPSPVVTTTFADTLICPKATIQIFASGGNTFKWFPVTGLSSSTISDPFASPVISTKYGVTVTNNFACADTAYVNVTIIPTVVANAGPDKTVIQGTPVTLEGSIQGQYRRYYWSPSTAINNVQILQPVVTPYTDVIYTLSVEAANGCGTSSDTMAVKVYKGIYIPNAFTPNGDGLNDTWSIPALNAYPAFELVVSNRYGQIVFQNKNVNQPWDGTYNGTFLANGTYVYCIHLNDRKEVIKGTVLILR